MNIAIDWRESSKGELVGKVLHSDANTAKLVEEIKNAPIDYPSMRSKSSTKTIEIVDVPKKAVEEVEQALASLNEGAVQVSSCKYKLNLEPGSQPDF